MLEQCISFQKDWQFNHQNPPGLSNPPGRRATPQFLSCWPVMPRPGGQACSTTIPVMLACRATTRRAGMQHHSSCHVGLSCHDQEGRRAAPQFLSCWPVMPRPGGQACSTTIPVTLVCHATTRRAGVQHHNSCHVGLSCHDQEGRHAAPQYENFSTLQSLSSITISKQTLPWEEVKKYIITWLFCLVLNPTVLTQTIPAYIRLIFTDGN